MRCTMRACSEARRSRNWDCTESGSCTRVSTRVSTVAARRPRELETYSADPRGVPTAVKPSSWCVIRSLAAYAATCSLLPP